MRTLITLAAILALALPAAAFADEGESQSEGAPAAETQSPTAGPMCKAQRGELGLAAFKLLHGTNKNRSNALGKCVVKLVRANKAAVVNAAKTCKAEKAMTDEQFTSAHDGKTFAEHYGTGKNGRNAFGKCVSQLAKENAGAAVENTTSAAMACKAELRMAAEQFKAAHDGKNFAEHYGANKRLSNAFGKCVAAAAKAAATSGTS